MIFRAAPLLVRGKVAAFEIKTGRRYSRNEQPPVLETNCRAEDALWESNAAY